MSVLNKSYTFIKNHILLVCIIHFHLKVSGLAYMLTEPSYKHKVFSSIHEGEQI